MISKFDDYLKEEYYKVINILKEKKINHIGSEILIFILISKQDSLFNCLCNLELDKFIDEVYKKNNEYDLKDSEKEMQEIIEFSYNLALKDHLNFINDEHLLYAILCFEHFIPYQILESIGINIDKIKNDVEDYFEFEEDDYLVNLTSLAKLNKFNPVVGRYDYIDKIIRILSKKQKSNCMLIGSAGVGKSALVEGVAMELLKTNSEITIYRLELGAVVAGTRYRGDLEERIVEMIKKVKEKNAILFIDEIHNIMGSSKAEDTINIANILKPALARNEIKCIGATTLEEYYEYIDKDKALGRRFQNIFIPEATIEETKEILNKIKSKYEDFYDLKYSKDVINEIIDCSNYFPNRMYPDKAIDIMDELGAYTKRKRYKRIYKNKVKDIVFENLGIKINNNLKKNKLNFDILQTYFNLFKNNANSKKNILTIKYNGNNRMIISDIKKLFGLTEESILKIDLELFDDYMYNYLLKNVLKYPILTIIISNFEKANYFSQKKIEKILEFGKVCDNNGRYISFKNTIFIINDDSFNKEEIGFNSSIKGNEISSQLIDLCLSDRSIIEKIKT